MSGPVLCDTGCCIVCPEMYFCTSKQFNKAHQYSFSFDIKQLLPNLSFFSLWGWLFFFFWIFFLLHISKYTTVLNKFIFKVTLHASSVSTVINCRTISVQPMWKRYKVWLDAISWGNDPQQWIKSTSSSKADKYLQWEKSCIRKSGGFIPQVGLCPTYTGSVISTVVSLGGKNL